MVKIQGHYILNTHRAERIFTLLNWYGVRLPSTIRDASSQKLCARELLNSSVDYLSSDISDERKTERLIPTECVGRANAIRRFKQIVQPSCIFQVRVC